MTILDDHYWLVFEDTDCTQAGQIYRSMESVVRDINAGEIEPTQIVEASPEGALTDVTRTVAFELAEYVAIAESSKYRDPDASVPDFCSAHLTAREFEMAVAA